MFFLNPDPFDNLTLSSNVFKLELPNQMKPRNFIFFSGAEVAEAEFENHAEKVDLQEVNLTFDGHKIFRSPAVRVLTTE